MHAFPHRYSVSATATPEGAILTVGAGLPVLQAALPVEFGGTGGMWSPEELLVAAVADCLVLTCRGIARSSRFQLLNIACEVTGTLDRIDRLLEFTRFDVKIKVEIPDGADADLARSIIAKAEQTCLITRSLKGSVHLATEVLAGATLAA